MAKIVKGYAATAEAAIMFDEPDTGPEIIPFENADQCKKFAELLARDYGDTDCYIPFEVNDEFENAFKGAVSIETAKEYIEAGESGADMSEKVWAFDDITLTKGGWE